MIVLNNNKIINCKQCNKKEHIKRMFIFSSFLYCFKCSMEKLKNNYKIY